LGASARFSPIILPITCTSANQLQASNLRLNKSLDAVDDGMIDSITVTYRITVTSDGNANNEACAPARPRRGMWLDAPQGVCAGQV